MRRWMTGKDEEGKNHGLYKKSLGRLKKSENPFCAMNFLAKVWTEYHRANLINENNVFKNLSSQKFQIL